MKNILKAEEVEEEFVRKCMYWNGAYRNVLLQQWRYYIE